MYNLLNFNNNQIILGLKDYLKICLINQGIITIGLWIGLKNINIDMLNILTFKLCFIIKFYFIKDKYIFYFYYCK
jgi:hypothetical protein